MTAPPVEANLVVPKGATFRHKWTLTDPGTGDPLDLTQSGYSALGQVRAWYGSATVYHEWSSDEVNLVLRANGELEIVVTGIESTIWTWWYGVYDIELTDPSEEVTRVASGSISVSPEVTQETIP